MKRYLGITIGPIIETMSYTSTPAGLWAASFFFSSITRDLCEELKEKEYLILTVPEQVEHGAKGIGQYHDRIYAVTPENKNDAEIIDEVKGVISRVIEKRAGEISVALSEEKDSNLEAIIACLQNYLQIHFILQYVEDTQELAKTLAEALDCLENCQSTVGNLSQNYLIRMLTGKRDNANCYLKAYEPFKDAKMLHKEEKAKKKAEEKAEEKAEQNIKIKDLYTIANNENAWKDHGTQVSRKLRNYFAIIQADGDGMGKIVNADLTEQNNCPVTLEAQENRIQMFSKLCMQYTADASKLIDDYEGVVIYAGGDDLLFLAPIISKNGNIWSLCKEIGEKFNSIFNPACNEEADKIVKENQVPSISFGVSVNYYKFPLYEAFEDARNLLFGTAKNFGTKNNFAISVHKASGQTSGYVCRMETIVKAKDTKSKDTVFEALTAHINLLIQGEEGNSQDNNQMMHSLLYHIENKRELCRLAIHDKEKRDKFFENIFDSTMQKKYRKYIDSINTLTEKIAAVVTEKTEEKEEKEENEKEKIASLAGESSDAGEKAVNVLVNVLRTSKFLVEERE